MNIEVPQPRREIDRVSEMTINRILSDAAYHQNVHNLMTPIEQNRLNIALKMWREQDV